MKTTALKHILGWAIAVVLTGTPTPQTFSADSSQYVLFGWNDLGMHCINPGFQKICVLPPYNNLWAQAVLRGAPPQVVTTPLTLKYSIANNKTVVGKTDFWQYVFLLFGVNPPVGTGLTGNGLFGTMTPVTDHFEAAGVPILPVNDLGVWNPFQTVVIAMPPTPGKTLVRQPVVVMPISDELNCAKCHAQNGDATMNLPGGGDTSVELNILAVHDYYHGTNGVTSVGESLVDNQPVLCARCHADNALGSAGSPVSQKSLSEVMHGWHQPSADRCGDVGCYDCHPGANTQCLRTAITSMGYAGTSMSPSCPNCHGQMVDVASSIAAGRRPWLDEPTCDQCHPAKYTTGTDTNGKKILYRHAKGHGGLYCAACHNSPHAWWPSKLAIDNSQPKSLQGTTRSIGTRCSICHTDNVSGTKIHTP